MNITQAIEQIVNAARSYLKRDEHERALIPRASQRPLLLYGPPGVGKTFAARQAADILGIAYLSYTMTHHTRQSALGLPQIKQQTYHGETYAVTEYTMSDILRDVYALAETEGGSKGILFLDEINCVSETLMPAMMELLQFKRFGRYSLPEGWIIVCAGNPEAYNRSARNFDTVALDRVRLIRVEADIDAYLTYAAAHAEDNTIQSYLRLHPDDLSVYTREGSITPRSWTDLSEAIRAARATGDTPGPLLFEQYLQDRKICENFAMHYALCTGSALNPESILDGTGDASAFAAAPFDLKVYIADALAASLRRMIEKHAAERGSSERIKNFLNGVAAAGGDPEACRTLLKRMEHAQAIRRDAGILRESDAVEEDALFTAVRAALAQSDPIASLNIKAARGAALADEENTGISIKLQNALDFADRCFNESSLCTLFITAMNTSPAVRIRMQSENNEHWKHLCSCADMNARRSALKERIKSAVK